jgi:hypothetical protein
MHRDPLHRVVQVADALTASGMTINYIHGNSARERTWLTDQATTLTELLHTDQMLKASMASMRFPRRP